MIKGPILHSIISILTFFLLLFIYTQLVGPIPFNVNNINTTVNDNFSVTGTGKVSVDQTEALVRAGVQAKGATPEAAQNQMNQVINKVSSAIQLLGIPQSDIKTQNYNINPEYDYSNGSQTITGYSGNTNLEITIKNVSLVNSVIDTATQNGANVIGGADFSVGDNTKAEDEARQKAVSDAKKKAANISKTAGFSMGRLVNYQENMGGEGQVVPFAADKAGGAIANPTQIEPGTNEVIVNVTLSYEIN